MEQGDFGGQYKAGMSSRGAGALRDLRATQRWSWFALAAPLLRIEAIAVEVRAHRHVTLACANVGVFDNVVELCGHFSRYLIGLA